MTPVAYIAAVAPGATVTAEWKAPESVVVAGLMLEHMRGLRLRVELDGHLIIEGDDPRDAIWPVVPVRSGGVLTIIFSNDGDDPVEPGVVALRCCTPPRRRYRTAA